VPLTSVTMPKWPNFGPVLCWKYFCRVTDLYFCWFQYRVLYASSLQWSLHIVINAGVSFLHLWQPSAWLFTVTLLYQFKAECILISLDIIATLFWMEPLCPVLSVSVILNVRCISGSKHHRIMTDSNRWTAVKMKSICIREVKSTILYVCYW